MRKSKCIIVLLFFLFTSQAFAAECGDVNLNGAVDIVDALLVAKYYVGSNPSNFNKEVADVNGDKNIDIVDALNIAQFYVSLISELSGCENEPKPSGKGDISLNDPVPGWASMSGGTTGGGTNMSNAVTVRSMGDLKKHAGGTDKKIILLEPGTYKGALLIGANKTIIGTKPGVVVKGYIQMRADKKDASGNKATHNIIIRNIAVQGDPCSEMRECRDGPDAIYMGGGAHHIWLDHLDVYDGQDGNCDATKAADFITVSWTQFRYTYNKPHRFSNLIAGKDSETESKGKLKMTYMLCWWGKGVEQRQPRGRFGDIHCFNNYHNSKSNENGKLYAIGPGFDMAIIVENCVFEMGPKSKAFKLTSYPGWRGVLGKGNIGESKKGYPMNPNEGKVFKIPYKYNLIPAENVAGVVTAKTGGAGNTCVFNK